MEFSSHITAVPERMAAKEWSRGKRRPDMSDATLVDSLNYWLSPFLEGMTRKEHLPQLNLTRILFSLLSPSQQSTLEQLAPASLSTPSGSK